MIEDLRHEGAGPLHLYAMRRAAEQPEPPREVPFVAILRLSYGSWPLRIAAGTILLFGIAVVAVAIALWDVALDPVLLLVLGLLFGVGMPLVPLFAGLRARRNIREGAIVRAEIVEVVDRVTRGGTTRIVGTAEHRVLDGAVRTHFDVEAPWASDLEEGDVIVGLVDSRRRSLWLGTPEGAR